MAKQATFWRDSIDDLTDEDFIDEIREYSLLHGCSLGRATRKVCERMHSDDPRFAGLVREDSPLVKLTGLDPYEFELRSIRVLYSQAGPRLEAAGERLRQAETGDIQRLAEAYEFQASFEEDPAAARTLWERAQEWWSHLHEKE